MNLMVMRTHYDQFDRLRSMSKSENQKIIGLKLPKGKE